MEKDKSAVEQFLEGIEGDTPASDPFNDNPTDPFAPMQTEKPVEEIKEVKEDKPIPFNKDPKIQRFIDKEIDKRLKNFKPEVKQEAPSQVDDDYYVRLIGNDTPEKVAMIKEAMARDEKLLQQAEERALQRLSQKEQEQIRADKEAEEELENAFESIEETFEVDLTSNTSVAKKTRQEFIAYVEKIAPKNENGDIVAYPDMPAAWEVFQENKKATATPNRAKELASRSMTRSAETTVETPRRTTWEEADAFIEGLK